MDGLAAFDGRFRALSEKCPRPTRATISTPTRPVQLPERLAFPGNHWGEQLGGTPLKTTNHN